MSHEEFKKELMLLWDQMTEEERAKLILEAERIRSKRIQEGKT